LDFGLKNWRIEQSQLTNEFGDLLSDTMFFISAWINPGASTLAAFGHWIEELTVQTISSD